MYLHENFSWIKTTDSTAIKDTLLVSNTFMGLLVSFRLNSAFQQWRAGIKSIGELAEAARTLMSSACAFVNLSSNTSQDNYLLVEEKVHFLHDLRRLICLYIAIVFHDVRNIKENTTRLVEMNLLTQDELRELSEFQAPLKHKVFETRHHQTVANALPNKQKAAICELWLRRLLLDASRRAIVPESQVVGILNGMVTRLTIDTAISPVPIPFCYAQFLELGIVSYLSLYTCAIVPQSSWCTPLWVFAWGLMLFLADDVANEIECPFGTDENDVDLEARLVKVQDELTVLLKCQYHFGGISEHHHHHQNMSEEDTPQRRKPRISLSSSVPSIDEYTSLLVQKSPSYQTHSDSPTVA